MSLLSIEDQTDQFMTGIFHNLIKRHTNIKYFVIQDYSHMREDKLLLAIAEQLMSFTDIQIIVECEKRFIKKLKNRNVLFSLPENYETAMAYSTKKSSITCCNPFERCPNNMMEQMFKFYNIKE